MTAARIELFDFFGQLRCAVPDVHPVAWVTIDEWLADMTDAADRDDDRTVAELAQCITQKIERIPVQARVKAEGNVRFEPLNSSTTLSEMISNSEAKIKSDYRAPPPVLIEHDDDDEPDA
jgi:hypothetical protein